MMGKGFVSILEVIVVVVTLFVAFQIFFPGFSYKNRWDDAILLLRGRDISVAMDRLGLLYDYSFDAVALENFLYDPNTGVIPITRSNIISWSETEGGIKNTIVIACNCTPMQLNYVRNWLGGMELNNRAIDAQSIVCHTNLNIINPCEDPVGKMHVSDLLIIWGSSTRSDKSLTNYESVLTDYLKNGNGILEILDLSSSEAAAGSVQEKIFGIKWNGGTVNAADNSFNKPPNASVTNYNSYKYFFHAPLPVKAPVETFGNVPIEVGLSLEPCSVNAKKGSFTFRSSNFTFWACGNRAYFDNDAPSNGRANFTVNPSEQFTLCSGNCYNFYLGSVASDNSAIGISFKPDYTFQDFLDSNTKLEALNQNILLHKGQYSGQSVYIPVAVVNGTTRMRTAWVSDFSRGSAEVKDDQKTLFMSLVLWTSNKEAVRVLAPDLIIKIGFKTSYVNVVNDDMYEVYLFNLGLGHPY
jgi:hypothetical protein